MSIEDITQHPQILRPKMNIVYTNLSPDTFIDESGINPGACVLAIIKTGETFTLIHAMPGSIVRELTALFLSLQPDEKMVLFFSNIQGNIKNLYDAVNAPEGDIGQHHLHGEILKRPHKNKSAKSLIRRLFRERDRTSCNYQ